MSATAVGGAVGPLVASFLTLPKSDRKPEENEDRAAGDPALGRFSISDGATTAARSEVWARLLTTAFVAGADPLARTTLAELRARWWAEVSRENLPWHAQEKLLQGSAATFAGLRLHRGAFEITAVGDSCFFHVRKQDLMLAAPLSDWTQFSRFSTLVHTDVRKTLTTDQVWSGGGVYEKGDVFLLATDAIAKHLLRRYAEDFSFMSIDRDPAGFTAFVERERRRGLADDDSTICVVRT